MCIFQQISRVFELGSELYMRANLINHNNNIKQHQEQEQRQHHHQQQQQQEPERQ